MECFLCRIAREEMGGPVVVGSNELAIAFVRVFGVVRGHVQVLPRRHARSFTAIEPAELTAMMELAQRVANAQKAAWQCHVTVTLADGRWAGQRLPHAHLHVIPRYRGDAIPEDLQGPERGTNEDLAATAAELRALVQLAD